MYNFRVRLTMKWSWFLEHYIGQLGNVLRFLLTLALRYHSCSHCHVPASYLTFSLSKMQI